MTPQTRRLAGCPECDALQHVPVLHAHTAAHCVRCGAELFRCQPASLERTLAFMLAAAALFAIAASQPLMELETRGLHTATTLFGTARALHDHGMDSVALLILATTLVVPAVQIGAFLAMLVPLQLGVVPGWLKAAYRIEHGLRAWVMLDVFMLGALIALVKLTQIASVHTGIGLYALGACVLARAAALQAFEPHELWDRVEALAPARPLGRGAPA